MTDRPQNPTARITALTQQPRYWGLGRALGWTQFGMAAERLVRAFWPLWTLFFVVVAAFAFGIGSAVPASWLLAPLGIAAVLALVLLVRGIRRFRWPRWSEALGRLDETLPGRPLSALTDDQAIGEDPATQAVWTAHLRRMATSAAGARAPAPDFRVSDRDPFGLRFVAVTALAMALLFGAIGRVAEVSEAVAAAPAAGPISAGPAWEGWVEPPLYTGQPSIYLNDLLQREITVPEGSQVTLRFYGDLDAISVDETVSANLSPPVTDGGVALRTIPIRASGTLSIIGPGGESYAITMIPDQDPTIEMVSAPEGVPPGQVQFEFAATDDYAVVGGTVIVSLDPEGAERIHGLSVDPEPQDPLELTLPMPFAGSRADFSEIFIDDLSEHPLANMPVTLALLARTIWVRPAKVSSKWPSCPGGGSSYPLPTPWPSNAATSSGRAKTRNVLRGCCGPSATSRIRFTPTCPKAFSRTPRPAASSGRRLPDLRPQLAS